MYCCSLGQVVCFWACCNQDSNTTKLQAHLYPKTCCARVDGLMSMQVLTVEQMMPAVGTSAVPMNISKAVRNNAGGVYNHLLFFKARAPLCPELRETVANMKEWSRRAACWRTALPYHLDNFPYKDWHDSHPEAPIWLSPDLTRVLRQACFYIDHRVECPPSHANIL